MNKEELNQIIASGENEKVEFKAGLPKIDIVSRHLASIANTAGGTIFFGIQEPNVIVGVDPIRVKALVESSLRSLSESIRSRIEEIEIDGKTVVAVSVDRAEAPIAVHGAFYARSGHTTRPMKAKEIEQSVVPRHSPEDISRLADGLEKQSLLVESLEKTISSLEVRLEKADSFKSKAAWMISGAVAGALLGQLASFI